MKYSGYALYAACVATGWVLASRIRLQDWVGATGAAFLFGLTIGVLLGMMWIIYRDADSGGAAAC